MMNSSLIEPIPASTNKSASLILNAAFEVHSRLGPGLLESVYQRCLVYELVKRKHFVQEQIALPIVYDGVTLEAALKLDLIVDRCVVVELKSVEGILPVHEAQLLTYLKLSGQRLGLLVNFNVAHLKDGIRRLVL